MKDGIGCFVRPGTKIEGCVDIHDPASVQNELQLFVGHFEDVSAV